MRLSIALHHHCSLCQLFFSTDSNHVLAGQVTAILAAVTTSKEFCRYLTIEQTSIRLNVENLTRTLVEKRKFQKSSVHQRGKECHGTSMWLPW